MPVQLPPMPPVIVPVTPPVKEETPPAVPDDKKETISPPAALPVKKEPKEEVKSPPAPVVVKPELPPDSPPHTPISTSPPPLCSLSITSKVAKPPVERDSRNGLDKVDASQYIDPIERSLASLERSIKAEAQLDVPECAAESSQRTEDPPRQLSSDSVHRSLIAQLGGLADVARVPDPPHLPHNGFPDVRTHQHSHHSLMPQPPLSIAHEMLSSPAPQTAFPPLQLPPVSLNPAHLPQPSPTVKREEVKPLLTPKPIEDLMGIPNIMGNNVAERNKYEMEKKMEEPKNSNPNFVQAFKLKQEQNVKNASSWSSLAQTGSPQALPSVAVNNQVKPKPVMDTFQVSLSLETMQQNIFGMDNIDFF